MGVYESTSGEVGGERSRPACVVDLCISRRPVLFVNGRPVCVVDQFWVYGRPVCVVDRFCLCMVDLGRAVDQLWVGSTWVEWSTSRMWSIWVERSTSPCVVDLGRVEGCPSQVWACMIVRRQVAAMQVTTKSNQRENLGTC